MHRITITLFLSFIFPVLAQSDQPRDLQPLPEITEPPPLPSYIEQDFEPVPQIQDDVSSAPLLPDIEQDLELEPQITIIKRGEDTIEEYRVNGELYMIKVTPRVGLPYYLVNRRGDGIFNHPGDPGSGVRAPMWLLESF